jgi:uncharacterized protein (TIGR00369 family)
VTELNGKIGNYGDGVCELIFEPKPHHRQHLGAVHGGIIGLLADDACAWACCSVAGDLVTAAYTVNFLAPATGAKILADGRLLKSGRRVAVGRTDVWSIDSEGKRTLAAVFQGTNALLKRRN